MNPFDLFNDAYVDYVRFGTPYFLDMLNSTIYWLNHHGFGWVVGAGNPTGVNADPCFDGRYFTCIDPNIRP